MANRFEYERLTPEDFQAALADLEMPVESFARITGERLDRFKEMMAGKRKFPPWVWLVLELLDMPGAIVVARDCAAAMILMDNLRPELGEYPYLTGRAQAESGKAYNAS